MSKHLETGRAGEQQAADWLLKQGFEIVARNYRYQKAEIDLIVRKEGLLVFVEVKARSGTAYGMPEAAVTSSKSRRIVFAAGQYIQEVDWLYEIRFDIISVIFKPTAPVEIEHIEDAFY